jgi:hypothetical protein
MIQMLFGFNACSWMDVRLIFDKPRQQLTDDLSVNHGGVVVIVGCPGIRLSLSAPSINTSSTFEFVEHIDHAAAAAVMLKSLSLLRFSLDWIDRRPLMCSTVMADNLGNYVIQKVETARATTDDAPDLLLRAVQSGTQISSQSNSMIIVAVHRMPNKSSDTDPMPVNTLKQLISI